MSASMTAILATLVLSQTRSTQVWHPIPLTVYSDKYHGRGTKSGAKYDRNKVSFAVPRGLWKRLGNRRIVVRFEGREVEGVVNDTCGPGVQNLDASHRAWQILCPNYKPTRIGKGVYWRMK